MEKLFGIELCEPLVPDLEALIEEPESCVLSFCGSDAGKNVDGVADQQTGYPLALQPHKTEAGPDKRGRRKEEVWTMKDGVGVFLAISVFTMPE